MPPLAGQLTWWVLLFPAALILAMVLDSLYLLNWVHVLSGVLWTGADLFMGFIVGPVLRRLDAPTRTSVIAYLTPRSLLYFPVVALTPGRRDGTSRLGSATTFRTALSISGRCCRSAW